MLIGAIAICIGVPVVLWMGVRIVSSLTPMAPQPSHSDVVTTVLAGLTISIAVLALMVATLAIWGFHAIKAEAKATATRAARAAAIRAVKGDQVQRGLREEAQHVVAHEFEKWKESYELSAS